MVRILLDKTNHTFKTKITDCVIWHHHHHHRCDCGVVIYQIYKQEWCMSYFQVDRVVNIHWTFSTQFQSHRCKVLGCCSHYYPSNPWTACTIWKLEHFNFHFILGRITRVCNECDLHERDTERERDCSGWICESCCESKNQEEANKTNLCRRFYPTFAPEEQSLPAHLLLQLGLHLCPNTGGLTQQEVMTW